MISKKSKIFVAGHKGMVGSAIIRKLKKKGFSRIISVDKKNLDLLDQDQVFKFLKKKKPDLVIVAAARVGGIQANSNSKQIFIYENLQIQNKITKHHPIFFLKYIFKPFFLMFLNIKNIFTLMIYGSQKYNILI